MGLLTRKLLLALVFTLALPVVLTAQAKTSVFVSAGGMRSSTQLRHVFDADSGYTTRLASAPVVSLGLERALFGALRVRGTLSYSPGKLAIRRQDGTSSCGSNCIRFEYKDDPIADAAMYAATADVVIPGPRVSVLRPYLLLGFGAKSYRFDQDALTGGFRESYARNEVHATGHAGAGLEIQLGRASALLEASDYFSTFPAEIGSSTRNAQNDASLRLGLKLPVF